MKICPCCHNDALESFDKVQHNNEIYLIKICSICLAIINETAFYESASRPQEIIQKAVHYESAALTLEDLQIEVESNVLNLNNLLKIVKYNSDKSIFCDFGAGRGCASIAAAGLFSSVYSIDFDINLILETLIKIKIDLKNITICSSINEIKEKVNFFYAWHSLEHIPDPKSFYANLRSFLAPAAILAIQVPLYRKEHVINCHYVFYSEVSFRRLALLWNYEVIDVIHDIKSSFITLIAKNKL